MRRSQSSRVSVWLRTIVAGAALAAGGSAAFAGPGQTTWTTFLYQGPGTRYAVTGEVPQATQVEVGACRDGWCEVSYAGRSGFVLSEVVAKGDPARPEPGVLAQPAASIVAVPAGPCFEVNQKGGNGGNALTVVCAK